MPLYHARDWCKTLVATVQAAPTWVLQHWLRGRQKQWPFWTKWPPLLVGAIFGWAIGSAFGRHDWWGLAANTAGWACWVLLAYRLVSLSRMTTRLDKLLLVVSADAILCDRRLAGWQSFADGTCLVCAQPIDDRQLALQCLSGHRTHIDCLTIDMARVACPLCLESTAARKHAAEFQDA